MFPPALPYSTLTPLSVMHPRALTRFIATALAAVTFAATGVCTDEITLLLSQASSAYRSGDYTEAIRSLDSAGALIHQTKTATLAEDLPAALPGWVAEAIQANAPGAMGEPNPIAVQQRFTRVESAVTVGLRLVGAHDEDVVTADSTETTIHYDGAEKAGYIALSLPRERRALITGHGVQQEELLAYANALRVIKV
jgi:hypothetical protein